MKIMTSFLSLFIAMLLAVGSHGDEPVEADLLYRTMDGYGYSISPKGRYLAQVNERPLDYMLVITDLEKSEIVYEVPLGKYYPYNLTWFTPRRLIYEQGGQLVATNIDGAERRVVLENVDWKDKKYFSKRWYNKYYRQWRILNILPDDPEVILVESRDKNDIARVQRVNVYTGEKDIVADGKPYKVSRWYVDRAGHVILGTRVKKNKIEFYLPNKPSNPDGEAGKVEYSLKGSVNQHEDYLRQGNMTGENLINRNLSIIEGGYDGDTVYVAENINTNHFRLSSYSISRQQVIEVLYEDQNYDVGSLSEEPILHFHDKEKKLLGMTYVADRAKSVWFDERMQTVQDVLDRRYKEDNNILWDWSSDLEKFLVYQQSSQHAGRVLSYLPEKKRIGVQADAKALLEGAVIPPTQTVHYSSADGTQHESYLTLPVGERSQPLPTVIMVHGGPWARYTNDYNADAAYFVTRGYAVLQVNFRGSTGFGRDYLLAGIKQIDSLMLDDIADGAKWAVAKKYTDPKRIYIMGTSYGGYAALMSTVRHPKLYRAAASLAAPLNLVTQIADYKKNDNHFAYAFWNYAVGDLKKGKKQLKKMSPVFNLNKLHTPFILFHGEDDGIVSVKQVREFEKQLKKSKLKPKIRVIKGEGHGLDSSSNQIYYIESALRLFEKEG